LPVIEWRPPARQGDVYRAARERPDAIGLIDGYFDAVPSVWHKEILWALSQGISVYGAASLGALRAAELDAFGMIGVGRVYEMFRDGVLTDDDEVAVLHGPAETDYMRLSLAMVDIRAMLEAAVAGHVMSHEEAARVSVAMKTRFYKDRTCAALLTEIVSAGRADAFPDFGRFRASLKGADALALTTAVVGTTGAGSWPAFRATASWHSFVAPSNIRSGDST
jgi:hypothetical protein